MDTRSTRRNWIRRIAMGMAGMLTLEHLIAKSPGSIKNTRLFNESRAQVNPKDSIKITRLEIIPVHG